MVKQSVRPIPLGKRWLALDVGSKRIGLAMSDPLHLTARPVGVVERGTALLDHLDRIVAESFVGGFVLGFPRREGGPLGELAGVIAELQVLLQSRYGLPVHLEDERYSTQAAEEVLARLGVPPARRRRERDAVAAAVFLQWFLDEHF
ncbi:MAG: Holliday junction resolvase RuvX [Acidobacteriota bacterium]